MKSLWIQWIFPSCWIGLSACSTLVGGYDRIEASDAGADVPEDSAETDAATGDSRMDVEFADTPSTDSADASATPEVPAPRFPWNGSTSSTETPRFMWSMDEGAYRIQLTRECNVDAFQTCPFVDLEVDIGDVTTRTRGMPTTFRPSSALAVSATPPVGSRYYWRVRACGLVGVDAAADSNCSSWSAIRYVNVGRYDHDFNGNGIGEVVVGAPTGDQMDAANAGRVHMYIDGAAPPMSLNNPEALPDGRFGSALSFGDINADGYADLIGSALFQTVDSHTLSGAVFIALGNASGDYFPTILHDPNPQSGAQFGRSVASGDLDGDGFAEVIVGTSRREDDHDSQGLVYIYWGSASGITGTPVRLAHPPALALARFGTAVSAEGDLDGNGRVDLAVSAVSENTDAGAVYLFDFDERNPTLTTRLEGERINDLFGISLAMGDMTGDGFAELMIGVETPGEVQVFRGAESGIAVTATNTITRIGMDENRFGGVLCNVGDLDGDGFPDLAVGARMQAVTLSGVGQVHLFLGRPDFPQIPITVESPNDLSSIHFGWGMTRHGDVNGMRGFVVGAPNQDIDGDDRTREGAVYLFQGAGLRHVSVLQNPDRMAGDYFGQSFAQ